VRKRLLTIMGPSVFVDLAFASALHCQVYGCQLLPHGVEPIRFVEELDKKDMLERWQPPLSTTDSTDLRDLNIIWCCKPEFLVATHLNILEQLDIAKNSRAVVLGPQLCLVVVLMCGLCVDQMTGPVLGSMFFKATKRHLQTLTVITHRGVQQMTENSICQMAEDWIDRLCQFVVDNGGMRQSLIALRECNNDHKEQCSVTSRGTPKCHVAECMLKRNRLHSLLCLGVQESNFK
ncbi:hypothetical protein GGH92_006044, partial [Coemansia sp. RSA 2673]